MRLTTAALAVALAVNASAGDIVLTNGVTVSGTVERVIPAQVVIRRPGGSVVTVPADQIAGDSLLSMPSPVSAPYRYLARLRSQVSAMRDTIVNAPTNTARWFDAYRTLDLTTRQASSRFGILYPTENHYPLFACGTSNSVEIIHPARPGYLFYSAAKEIRVSVLTPRGVRLWASRAATNTWADVPSTDLVVVVAAKCPWSLQIVCPADSTGPR